MIPLIVNTPDPMVKFRVMTTKDYSTKTLKTLHSAGVLHVEESEELKPVDKEAIEEQRTGVGKLLTGIDGVLAYVPKGEKVSLKEDLEVIYTRPFDEIDSEVTALCTKLSNMHQRAAKLSEEIDELTELNKYLGPLRQQLDIKLKDLSFSGTYLFSRIFVLPSEAYQPLQDKLRNYLLGDSVAAIENETIFYVIARVEDRNTIESVVKDGGGRIQRIPNEDITLREFLEVAHAKIDSFQEELTGLRAEIENKTRENLEKLILFREALLAENERLAVLEKACEAKYVTLIEGWIPENNVEDTISELRENIGYVFIDTRKPEKTEEPPTRMRNSTGFKPFEVIVNLFGIPKYREWDPTPIIAYSFAFFFGLMLCDVVYAIGIILATRFLLRRFVEDPESEGFKLFTRILYISSGVGLVFGLLVGAYLGNFYEFFGIESGGLALWGQLEQALADPVTFIIISIVIGLIHVNIAHSMALIKGIKEKAKGVVLNKIGLFMLQIFGIPYITHSFLNFELLPLSASTYSIFLYVIGASLLLIVASGFIMRGGLGAIFWLFDITGILGDVMSYCRIAGVSLATLYLAQSFNMIADKASGMMPGVIGGIIGVVIGIIILLFTHALNLFLAGLASFIHSLRLCFVEFMMKFYEGDGRAYTPFRLRTRTVTITEGR